MNAQDIIRAAKFDLKVTDWRTGHIPRVLFPLSKSKPRNYKFGPEYQWRLVTFSTSMGKFRVLILLNEGKSIFRATLAAEAADGDLIVVCQHEYHQSEPGWHCHVTFESVDKLPRGVVRSQLKRWPKYRPVHAEVVFRVNAKNALSLAAKCLKFSDQGVLI